MKLKATLAHWPWVGEAFRETPNSFYSESGTDVPHSKTLARTGNARVAPQAFGVRYNPVKSLMELFQGTS